MTNNNYNLGEKSACLFAEKIVAVLYGEAAATEKSDFDAHLLDCSACAEELSAFAFVRNGIADWRETDFVPLDLPAIVLPFEPIAVSASKDKASWLEKTRGFFAPPNFWMPGAAAFAALLICAVLFFPFGIGTQSIEKTTFVYSEPKVEQSPFAPLIEPTNSPIDARERAENEIRQANELSSQTIVQVISKPARANVKTINKTVSGAKKEIFNSSRPAPAAANKKSAAVNQLELEEILSDESEEETPSLTDLLDEITPTGE